jgi:hypothetical protein
MNMCTGTTLQIRLPTLKEYTHHGNAEGLPVRQLQSLKLGKQE